MPKASAFHNKDLQHIAMFCYMLTLSDLLFHVDSAMCVCPISFKSY